MTISNYNPFFVYNNLFSVSQRWRFTQEIIWKCKKWIRRYRKKENILGKIGETYVWYNIKYTLEESGLSWSDKIQPNSYYMKSQYQTKKNKTNGSIDVYLRLVEEYYNTYSIKIEVSNWKPMIKSGISKEMFNRKIGDKFDKYDSRSNSIRISIIPYYNIRYIQRRCDEKDIFIIPMEKQVEIEDITNR
ncbi:MAG: hypothetical protein JSW06_00655 [Thermoplasmatales archaeon]|nr:MAG: hypothetical protein JSW06_00655 [Thermoplasmatales archaeon]